MEDLNTGRVGAPLPCCDIMLREWAESGYSPFNTPYPQGEILISGANVSEGYLNNPEKTAEDFININGRRWFCTGDIGQMLPDGTLKIIGKLIIFHVGFKTNYECVYIQFRSQERFVKTETR